MAPYSLHLAGVLLTFTLKVATGFVFCLALASLLPGPRHRFMTWLAFMLGAGLVWIELLADETVSLFAKGPVIAEPVRHINGEHLIVPAAWGVWISGMMVAVAAAYVAGAGVLLARAGYKHLRLYSWLKHGRRPSPELESVFQTLCREFNIRRSRLWVLPQVSSPATVYWWKPIIIVPEVCEELAGTEQLKNVLRHELVHTLRCDYLWATLSDLFCALLFFHPAVWQARKRLAMQRELACDLAVVQAQPDHRADYAESLAHFMRLVMVRQRVAFGVDFAGSSSLLGTRIRCILTEPAEVPRWKQASADAAMAVFVILFVSISPALSVSLDLSRDTAPSSVNSLPQILRPSMHIRKGGVRVLLRESSSDPLYQDETITPVAR